VVHGRPPNLVRPALVFIRVNPYIWFVCILKGTTMSKLIQLIQALIPHLQSQKAVDDAYLAQASDIHDLEMRMVTVEVRNLWTSRGELPA